MVCQTIEEKWSERTIMKKRYCELGYEYPCEVSHCAMCVDKDGKLHTKNCRGDPMEDNCHNMVEAETFHDSILFCERCGTPLGMK